MNAREIRQAELEGEIENAQQALQTQLKDYKEKGGDALIVIGILVSAFALYKILTSSDEEPTVKIVKEEPKESFLSNAFVGLVLSAVVGVAKDQIFGFIKDKIQEKNTNDKAG